MEKLVVCNCPAEFVLSILGPLPGNTEMAACMKCGRSDLGDAVVSEDHPHDVQFLGYRRCDLSAEARAWASAWPRYSVVDDTRIYLPATVRFQAVAEPPASLPEQLAGFVEIWNGLQLNDQTPVDQLLDAATRFNGPNRLAASNNSRSYCTGIPMSSCALAAAIRVKDTDYYTHKDLTELIQRMIKCQ